MKRSGNLCLNLSDSGEEQGVCSEVRQVATCYMFAYPSTEELPCITSQEYYSRNTRYFTQNTEESVLCETAALPIQRQTTLNDLRPEFEDFSALERANGI